MTSARPQPHPRSLSSGLRATSLLALTSVVLVVVGHELERGHPQWDGYRIAAYASAALLALAGIAATRLRPTISLGSRADRRSGRRALPYVWPFG